MIELYIDGQAVILNQDLNISLVTKNPYVTKEGDYTLDIDIPLIGGNRKIYANIDRVTNTINNKKDRSVILKHNGTILISGTEILLSNDNEYVKIQVLSGNSELNYRIRENTKIRNMDLGFITYTPLSAMQLNGVWDEEYKRQDYCFPLINIIDNDKTFIANNFPRAWTYDPSDIEPPSQYGELPHISNLYPQLYLGFAIDKLIQTLGYKVAKNIFSTDPVLKYLVMCSCNNSAELNELYPNMGVKDFITLIEESFAVIINVSQSGYVTIERLSEFISAAQKKQAESLDDFSIEYIEEDKTASAYEYKCGDSKYHKRTILNENIIGERPLYSFANFNDTKTFFLNKGLQSAYNDNLIAYNQADKTYFYAAKEDNRFILSELATFTDLRNEEKKEIKCVPSECNFSILDFKIIEYGQYIFNSEISMYIPVIKKPAKFTEQALDEAILNGLKKEQKQDCIHLMFYSGLKPVKLNRSNNKYITVYYSLPFQDYCTYYARDQQDWIQIVNDGAKKMSLRINAATRIKEDLIDTTLEYKFQLLKREHINNIFIIQNKRFMAKEITSIYSHSGFKTTAVFYPLK